MHFLPCGNRAGETAMSSHAIGVFCTVAISVLSTTVDLGEWEGGRQAKVGENARPWLQHIGALRPFLSIETMQGRRIANFFLVRARLQPRELR